MERGVRRGRDKGKSVQQSNKRKINPFSSTNLKPRKVELDESSEEEEKNIVITEKKKEAESFEEGSDPEDFDSSIDESNLVIADSSHSDASVGEKQEREDSDSDEESDDNHLENEEVSKNDSSTWNDDCAFGGWPKEDILRLINSVEKSIPKNDSLKYTSRVEKINWSEVKFDNYSMLECKEKWKFIQKKLRKYRLLKELIEDAKVWLDKPWVDFYRGGKKNKHPDMPKRPLSSYMLYYLDKKNEMAEKNPGLDMTGVSKLLAEKYKTLNEEQKSEYNMKAMNMRAEYKDKMKQFKKEHPIEAAAIFKKGSPKTSTNTQVLSGPIKPSSPFKLFLDEKMKQMQKESNVNKGEFLSEMKSQWKNMSEKKKSPWIQWAREAEINYLEELKNFKAENHNFIVPKHKPVLSKEEQKIFERLQGKPEKPPNSAYSLFSRLLLKDLELREKFSTPNERMKEIANLWQMVSSKEKEAYAQKAKLLMDNYKLEYASYLESLSEDKREEELDKNKPKKRGQRVHKKTVKRRRVLKKEEQPKVKIRKEILAQEPKPPPVDAFTLFKETYLLNPSHKVSEVRAAWCDLPEREHQRYKTKLEELKQKYLLNFRQFLMKLKPNELKKYTAMRCNSTLENDQESESSDNDSDEEESVDCDSTIDSEDDSNKKMDSSSSEPSD